jgi:hypothetical protein
MPAKPFRIAKSLEKLRAQINATFPHRSKLSDGWIGDPSHQSTNSDHNPHIIEAKWRVVSALDITNDPAHGCEANKIAKALIAGRDARIKYVISNGRIASSFVSGKNAPWAWRAYTGKNKHDHHFHISVRAQKSMYDSEHAWKF